MTAGASRDDCACIATPSTVRGDSFSVASQNGKENDVANVRSTGEIHEKSVETDAHASHRRHAVLHRAEIILVDTARLEIAGGPQFGLRFESTTLIDGIIELAECVGELFPLDE